MEPDTENRLLARARGGDRASFEELVRAYFRRAFGIASVILYDREEALDATQEAFLRAWASMPRFRAGEPFFPWLYRILRNACLRSIEKRSRARALSIHEEEGRAPISIPDGRSGPAEEAASGETRRLFWEAYRELAENDREILALRHFAELPYGEIASVLEIPIGTVMSRLFHARRRLRERLDPILGGA
ncbi:MAG: RNA polymerase sigma factor [Planctomycetota bacterium]